MRGQRKPVKFGARVVALTVAAIAIAGAFVALFVFLLFVLPKP